MKQIILASNSYRRKELLKKIILDFQIEPSDIEEKFEKNILPYDLIKKISYYKAKDIFDKHKNSIIISGDTAVNLDGEIIGKPERELIDRYGEKQFKLLFDSNVEIKKEAEKLAYNMLKKFSGRTYEVLTGVCIMSNKRIFNEVSVVKVKFSKLEDKDIYDYIKTGEPFGKAGGYGAQDSAGKFIEHIGGDFYSIVGFPLNMVFNELKNIDKY